MPRRRRPDVLPDADADLVSAALFASLQAAMADSTREQARIYQRVNRQAPRLGDAEAIGLLADHLKMVAGITATTRAHLQDIIEDGITRGLTYAQIARIIEADESGLFTRARAERIARTSTAHYYNVANVRMHQRNGVEWFDVTDGAECGWAGHDSSPKANGLVVSADQASEQPLSHPNCVRVFVPKPRGYVPTDAEVDAASSLPVPGAAEVIKILPPGSFPPTKPPAPKPAPKPKPAAPTAPKPVATATRKLSPEELEQTEFARRELRKYYDDPQLEIPTRPRATDFALREQYLAAQQSYEQFTNEYLRNLIADAGGGTLDKANYRADFTSIIGMLRPDTAALYDPKEWHAALNEASEWVQRATGRLDPKWWNAVKLIYTQQRDENNAEVALAWTYFRERKMGLSIENLFEYSMGQIPGMVKPGEFEAYLHRNIVGVIVHEFGHFIEHSDYRLNQAADDFRAEMADKVKWSAEHSAAGIVPRQYLLKTYPDGATEVISVLLEELHDNPQRLRRLYPDSWRFILDVLNLGRY